MIRSFVFLALIGALSILTGCAGGAPKAYPRAAFDQAEYQKYAQPGTSTVFGVVSFVPYNNPSASYKTSDVIQKVYLVPATAHEDAAVTTGYRYNYNVALADPRRAAYLRSTVANADGRFSFTKVPAGDYYIVRLAAFSVDFDSTKRFKFGAERIAIAQGQDLDLKLEWAHDDRSGQNASILCEALDPGIVKASNPMTAVCASLEGTP